MLFQAVFPQNDTRHYSAKLVPLARRDTAAMFAVNFSVFLLEFVNGPKQLTHRAGIKDARVLVAVYYKTIFIVSQRTSSIQFADNIIVLDDGQMVGFGPHEKLLETCETYKEIYDSQFKKESDMTRQKEV